jgi:hypothetical protein
MVLKDWFRVHVFNSLQAEHTTQYRISQHASWQPDTAETRGPPLLGIVEMEGAISGWRRTQAPTARRRCCKPRNPSDAHVRPAPTATPRSLARYTIFRTCVSFSVLLLVWPLVTPSSLSPCGRWCSSHRVQELLQGQRLHQKVGCSRLHRYGHTRTNNVSNIHVSTCA